MFYHDGPKRKYYTVFIPSVEQDKKVPYTVLAVSDYHAARLVKQEIGYFPKQTEVQGPYARV